MHEISKLSDIQALEMFPLSLSSFWIIILVFIPCHYSVLRISSQQENKVTNWTNWTAFCRISAL